MAAWTSRALLRRANVTPTGETLPTRDSTAWLDRPPAALGVLRRLDLARWPASDPEALADVAWLHKFRPRRDLRQPRCHRHHLCRHSMHGNGITNPATFRCVRRQHPYQHVDRQRLRHRLPRRRHLRRRTDASLNQSGCAAAITVRASRHLTKDGDDQEQRPCTGDARRAPRGQDRIPLSGRGSRSNLADVVDPHLASAGCRRTDRQLR
jgi:hypothetical protein